MSAEQPIFNVPKGVVTASAIMVAVQLVLGFLPDDAALYVVRLLAFIPARYSGAAAELPGGYIACVTSFVTYMIVHAGWVHLLVNLCLDGCFWQWSGEADRGNQVLRFLHSLRYRRRADASGAPFRRDGAGGRCVRCHFRTNGRRAQGGVRGPKRRQARLRSLGFAQPRAKSHRSTHDPHHRDLGRAEPRLRSRRGDAWVASRARSPGKHMSAASCLAYCSMASSIVLVRREKIRLRCNRSFPIRIILARGGV